MKRKTPEELYEEITKLEPTSTSLLEGSSQNILKLKKEAVAADGLWREVTRRDVPGGMERWLKARAAAVKAEETHQPTKKRKKLVKRLLAPKFIESLRARGPPRTFTEISDERLSGRSEIFRREYLARKYRDGKWADYQNALIEQYDLLGYAEDEEEFTDDEDDDVVKMGSLDIR